MRDTKKKKKIYFNVPLNGNKRKNYVMEAIEEMNIAFMFNTKPIPFYVDVMIYRSVEYVGVLSAERDAGNNNTLVETRRNLIPVSLPSANTMNKKQILNAEKTFKEGECVICLTEPPNVLFCNCGHPCLCIECSKKRKKFRKLSNL